MSAVRIIPAGLSQFSLALLFAGTAEAAFTKYPYVQNLTDSSAVVRWETSTAAPGLVQYGFSSEYGFEVSHSTPDTVHELTLSGLVADTVYHYRVISGPDTSPDAQFSTIASPDRPFRLIVYADTHGDSTTQQTVVNRMNLVEPRPGLLVHCGDVTASGTLDEYRVFFNVERPLLCRTPFFPCLGNHDLGSITNWRRFFCLPGNERWYSVRYGNAAFHCLDDSSSYAPGSEQYEWFLSELLADSANPNIRHVFVWFHYPPYTTNQAYTGNMRARQYLCPLFERFGIRVCFNGHVHAYEHSLVSGVHYITTGGGGAALATGWNAAQPWTVYRQATYHFTLLDIRGDTVFSRGIKPDGTVFDSFAIVASHTWLTTGPVSHLSVSGPTALPLPAAQQVRISFRLSEPEHIELVLFNPSGRQVAALLDQMLQPGEHTVTWKPAGVTPGQYFCVLRTKSGALRRKSGHWWPGYSVVRVVLAR